jgi:ornithine cyclodeaminase/alanine dehydrogenase-like protein (mu-crystallin family)
LLTWVRLAKAMTSEQKTILYLSRKDVERVGLSMPEIIDTLENMFVEKGEGRVEMPPKPGIHTRKDAFIHAMPAYIPGLESAGMKWVSGYPENHKKSLPYISGLLILNDAETGFPIAVMDATWITAQRTGAATAVAAKYLARRESSSVGILACGVQGRSNLEALACLFSIERVKAYDIEPETAKKFATEMADIVQAEIETVNEPRQAVDGLDIVVTSGPILKNPFPVIEPGWLSEGSFASPVDFDSYWTGEALKQADKLATDDISQMEYYRQAGYFKETPLPYADLGEIVVGTKPGRERPDERVICINLGLALDDMATAILIYKKALKIGIGSRLPL